MKNSVLISHAECMCEPSISYPANYLSSYDIVSSEQVMENGRLVRKSLKKNINPVDNFSGLKASDFALENIIAVGAEGSLRDIKLNVGSVADLADSMDSTIDNIIAAVDSAESNLNDGGNE